MMILNLRNLFASLFVITFSAFAAGEITYRITPSSDRELLHIQMSFDVSTPAVEFQLPSWLPGRYAIQNSWETLRDLVATDESGSRLDVAHVRGDSWIITTGSAKHIIVRYERPLQKARFDADQSASETDVFHYGAQPVYLYIVGRKNEPCLLELVIPAEWKSAVGLRQIDSIEGHPTYVARSYDELADNPVTMGTYLEEHYKEFSKDHILAFRGPARDWVDRGRTLQMARFVTRIEGDFFGEVPYEKYIWHFWVYEGTPLAGGTEHASSTEMHLSTEEGSNTLQGMAHEFFHLWNAKLIHPQPLGPFDYTQLPHTGSLWWIEGVTDYYSMLLPYRYGAWNREVFLDRALDEIQQVRGNPARFEVSPYDASYKISQENGNNYKVNYYPTGWVLAMMFDIELRSRTEGKVSLDEVVKALWGLCKNDQPGFAEDEIRRQLVRFGGAEMGPLYDQWVLRPGELPVEQELAKAGLLMEKRGKDQGTQIIHESAEITAAQRRILEDWLWVTRSSKAPPPSDTIAPAASPDSDTSRYESYTGRYEIANNVLFTITGDARGLSAGLEQGDKSALTLISHNAFFYTRRNAEMQFVADNQGEITHILWKQNGKQRSVPRIGPFIHSLQAHADPDPAFTLKLRAVLQALGYGVHTDARTPGLSSGAWADYCASGPVRGLAGIQSLDYIDSQNVAGRHIERHQSEVSQISYYKLVMTKKTRYLMVYLTADRLLTDFDYVED
jgi:predicted metalloprotease with PDZ domain